MKVKTKVALIELARVLQELATAVVLTTGTETASRVVGKAELLIIALKDEETTP